MTNARLLSGERQVVDLRDPRGEHERMDGLVDLHRHLAGSLAPILHGHKHQLMGIDYTFGAHKVGCPGAFPNDLGFNIIDFDIQDEVTFTEARVRGL